MSLTLLQKIPESMSYHAGKSRSVRFQGIQFNIGGQLKILEADTGTVYIQIHSSYFVYQRIKLFFGPFLSNINGADLNSFRGELLKGL